MSLSQREGLEGVVHFFFFFVHGCSYFSFFFFFERWCALHFMRPNVRTLESVWNETPRRWHPRRTSAASKLRRRPSSSLARLSRTLPQRCAVAEHSPMWNICATTPRHPRPTPPPLYFNFFSRSYNLVSHDVFVDVHLHGCVCACVFRSFTSGQPEQCAQNEQRPTTWSQGRDARCPPDVINVWQLAGALKLCCDSLISSVVVSRVTHDHMI